MPIVTFLLKFAGPFHQDPFCLSAILLSRKKEARGGKRKGSKRRKAERKGKERTGRKEYLVMASQLFSQCGEIRPDA
jgi:hypothetical protein